mmetsp:Transcript_135443/g.337939  ORF Transcript_135443/g.337939 Transcript_135443/m.337939 type:complete len:247 (-) Transcript_135443:452-1192(-)
MAIDDDGRRPVEASGAEVQTIPMELELLAAETLLAIDAEDEGFDLRGLDAGGLRALLNELLGTRAAGEERVRLLFVSVVLVEFRHAPLDGDGDFAQSESTFETRPVRKFGAFGDEVEHFLPSGALVVSHRPGLPNVAPPVVRHHGGAGRPSLVGLGHRAGEFAPSTVRAVVNRGRPNAPIDHRPLHVERVVCTAALHPGLHAVGDRSEGVLERDGHREDAVVLDLHLQVTGCGARKRHLLRLCLAP